MVKYRGEMEKLLSTPGQNIQNFKNTYPELLEDIQNLYRKVFEDAPLGLTVFDTGGNILLVNSSMLEILGSPSTEATKSINVLHYPPMIKAGISGTLQKCLDTGEKLVAEHFYTTRWGKSVYMRLWTGPLRDRNGKVAGAALLVEDITQRRREEDTLARYTEYVEGLAERRAQDIEKLHGQLCQSEERLHKIFNASTNLNCIIKMKDRIIKDVNRAWVDLTGYSKEEVLGRSIDDVLDRQDWAGIIADARRQGAISNREIKFKTWSGNTRTGLLSGDIVHLAGEECLYITVNDVTEFSRMKEEIGRLDRLNLVGEMAAGVAHEIRNPITTVYGFLQMLASKTGYSEHEEYFHLMLSELDRVNLIITEFLSLARNIKVEMQQHNLNNIINTISPMIWADALHAGKKVELELGEIPDLYLNEKEMRQLILNLARNGLEAMQPGGCLTIKTYMDGECPVLAVQDQGEGIDPGVLDQVGRPFFTTKENGTGLGLAISNSIAEKHNASIKINSGKTGTTFYIRFQPE